MKNKPNKIYLQLGLEDNGETCKDFNELHDISWCSDKVYSDDLEYISVDFILRRIKEIEEGTDEPFSKSIAISELKNLLK